LAATHPCTRITTATVLHHPSLSNPLSSHPSLKPPPPLVRQPAQKYSTYFRLGLRVAPPGFTPPSRMPTIWSGRRALPTTSGACCRAAARLRRPACICADHPPIVSLCAPRSVHTISLCDVVLFKARLCYPQGESGAKGAIAAAAHEPWLRPPAKGSSHGAAYTASRHPCTRRYITNALTTAAPVTHPHAYPPLLRSQWTR
jgi:hypothetical protein